MANPDCTQHCFIHMPWGVCCNKDQWVTLSEDEVNPAFIYKPWGTEGFALWRSLATPYWTEHCFDLQTLSHWRLCCVKINGYPFLNSTLFSLHTLGALLYKDQWLSQANPYKSQQCFYVHVLVVLFWQDGTLWIGLLGFECWLEWGTLMLTSQIGLARSRISIWTQGFQPLCALYGHMECNSEEPLWLTLGHAWAHGTLEIGLLGFEGWVERRTLMLTSQIRLERSSIPIWTQGFQPLCAWYCHMGCNSEEPLWLTLGHVWAHDTLEIGLLGFEGWVEWRTLMLTSQIRLERSSIPIWTQGFQPLCAWYCHMGCNSEEPLWLTLGHVWAHGTLEIGLLGFWGLGGMEDSDVNFSDKIGKI